MRLIAVSLISAAIIGYEILLMRLYAIVQWHHFAFMIISIALLGFGASGTALALSRRWVLARVLPVWQANAAAFGATSLLAFALAQRLPFNPLELAWEPRQFLYLGATYLLLMVPFFCGANCIALAFMHRAREPGRVYRFDLLGAGSGAAGVIGLLFVLDPEDCVRVTLGLGLLAAAVVGLGSGDSRAGSRTVALAAAALALPFLVPDAWLALRISPYKSLSHALRVPGAEVIHQTASPLGLVSVVRSPTIPFRHVPGLSLSSTAEPPEQLGLFTDGDGLSAITRHRGPRSELAYLDQTTEALPYHLLERPDVALLGAGTGAGVLLAQYHEAPRIDAVEINPQVIGLMRGRFADYAGDPYGRAGTRVHIAEARGYIAGVDARYDLIQLPILESFGAAVAGSGGLSETYVYTTEAFVDYLEHVRPGGFLAVTRWAKLPPRDALKVVATAVRALERSGLGAPEQRLAVIRGWKTTTVLVKNGVLSEDELRSVRAFARRRSFDLVHLPGMGREEANRYNILEAPYFYDGVAALLGPGRDRFAERYKFDLTPATDDRPYFFDFFKWRVLPELLELRARGALPLIEWGYIILIATLAQAGLLSVVLILLPLRGLRATGTSRGAQARVVAYFLSLGLAFLFVEIAFIQKLVLFLGHPLYAVAVVLAAFLVFAGLGAGLSARLRARMGPEHTGRAIACAVGAIAVFAVLQLALLPWTLGSLMALPVAAKLLVGLGLIAPLALFMGMPFPLGLAHIADRAAGLIPWAWGINGCASVISAVLATVLAIDFGFTVVVGAAVLLYGLAALAFSRPL